MFYWLASPSEDPGIAVYFRGVHTFCIYFLFLTVMMCWRSHFCHETIVSRRKSWFHFCLENDIFLLFPSAVLSWWKSFHSRRKFFKEGRVLEVQLKPGYSATPKDDWHTKGHRNPVMSFPMFSDLPAELRLKIWSFALPLRRVVEVSHRASHPFHGPSSQDSAFLSIKTTLHDLALLSTCFESRAMALKSYRIHNFPGFHSPFYFNPNQDAVLMSNPECLQDFCSREITSQFKSSIKHLAVDPLHTRLFHHLSGESHHPHIADAMTYTRFEALNLLTAFLRDFSGLQELTILHPKTHVDLPFADMLMVRLEWLWMNRPVEERVLVADDGNDGEVWEGPHISNVMYDFAEGRSTMRESLAGWKGCQGRRQMCRGRWHN